MTDELVEIVAREIDPGAWEVMDFAEKKMREKYAGKDVGWPADQFKHKESMKTALAALRAIEGAGYKVVGREATEGMLEAMENLGIARYSDLFKAAFDAAPTVGGGE